MSRICIGAIFALAASGLGEVSKTAIPAAQRDGSETIIASWLKRQSDVKTWDFAFKGRKFQKLRKSNVPNLQVVDPENKKELPPNVSYEIEMRSVADDAGRFRFEQQDMLWSAEKWELIPRTLRQVFDGNLTTVASVLPSGGDVDFSGGSVYGKKDARRPPPYRLNPLLPLRMVYRPFHKDWGDFDRKKIKLTSDQGVVDQKVCLILQQDGNLVWVDPTMDYLPVRYFYVSDGITLRSIEVRYARDSSNSWILDGWKDVRILPNGEVSESMDVTTVTGQLNPSIPNETFDVAFQPGSWVSNSVTKEKYAVKEDGTKRPITHGEFTGRNFQEILHSDPPGTRKGFVFWLTGAFVVLTVGAAVWYWHLKRKGLNSA